LIRAESKDTQGVVVRYSPLLTDLYELTMLAGYLEEGMTEQHAVFDLFFRTNPFEGGYALFAGLGPVLEYLENLRFSSDELAYLETLGLFKPGFIDFLREFRFRGSVTAPPEGSVVFAGEPLLTVEGSLAEAQFVETALLTIINYQTLVATKGARMVQAAAGGTVVEFGLRRAHGPDGGLSCSRAASVGGVRGSSNVLAGMEYGIPMRGTQAHSWIMAFPDELTSFRAYARAFPDSCILLVDTWDTLKSGVPHAITVARELREQRHRLQGIRIDSGDLVYLSRKARQMLDEAGFPEVKIVGSNDLDEYLMDSMKNEGSRIDIYGVGTRLVTCAGPGGGALGGVYKLVELEGRPLLKRSEDPAKSTLPGCKRLLRVKTPEGRFLQDLICLEGETPQPGDTVHDPTNSLRQVQLPAGSILSDLRSVVMRDGVRCGESETLDLMADRSGREVALLPEGCRRFINPHRYKVSVTTRLSMLREQLLSLHETGE
jgi:nicotinate phosphoribosyltransferase